MYTHALYNAEFSKLLIGLSSRVNKDLFKTERLLSDMLHVVRDNLPYDKAVLLYHALPEYMKNFYTAGWNNSTVEKPAIKFSELMAQFLECEADLTEESFKQEKDVKRLLLSVFEMLKGMMPGSQLKKVILALPEDIRMPLMNAVFHE